MRNVVAPTTEPIVTARDEAILKALKLRKWTTAGLLTVLPAEPGQTVDERQHALKSALIRLRVKGKVRQDQAGAWELR